MRTYIVEHLDPELEAWSSLEYSTIAKESAANGSQFILSSVSPQLVLPPELKDLKELRVEQKGVEELYADREVKVCLLDPAAKEELCPEDCERFEVFLFGGILGMKIVEFLKTKRVRTETEDRG